MKIKQKMIIRMPMNSDECRSKALRIVARAQGTIISVSIGGLNGDELVVTGEGVDPATLVQSLRKKFPPATILSVQQISDDDEGSSLQCSSTGYCPVHDHGYLQPSQYTPAYYVEYPQRPMYNGGAQHAPDLPSICSIM